MTPRADDFEKDNLSATDDDDDRDDRGCLRRVQSLYQPLSILPPLTPPAAGSDDDDVDDLETVRAIMKRFSTYDEGI